MGNGESKEGMGRQGDGEMGKWGDGETWRRGDVETWRCGDAETWRCGRKYRRGKTVISKEICPAGFYGS